MDWFHRLTGFRERDYADTRRRLEVDGRRLRSRVNGRAWAIGTLELPSLARLRERVRAGQGPAGRLQVRTLSGDARALHRAPEFAGALFQVASQFNMLEMIDPSVRPEDGVCRYERDRTQGPACAIAAGAATIFRNYFAPVGEQAGQTADRQLDGLADLGVALGQRLGQPVERLWRMQNGYALCTADGLAAIGRHLTEASENERDALRGLLRIGLHRDVGVTDGAAAAAGPLVSQAFCSALPVAYTRLPARAWAPFATLVLEAAYEATLWAAVLAARDGGSNVVLLTRVGGGAFGNADAWIDRAMRRALDLVRSFALDVRLVSFDAPPESMRALARAFA